MIKSEKPPTLSTPEIVSSLKDILGDEYFDFNTKEIKAIVKFIKRVKFINDFQMEHFNET